MDVLTMSPYPAVNWTLTDRQIMKTWGVTHEYWERIERDIAEWLTRSDLPTLKITSRENGVYINSVLWDRFRAKHFTHIRDNMVEKTPQVLGSNRARVIQGLFNSAVHLVRTMLKKAKKPMKDPPRPPRSVRKSAKPIPPPRSPSPKFIHPPPLRSPVIAVTDVTAPDLHSGSRHYAVGVSARPAGSTRPATTTVGIPKDKGKDKILQKRKHLADVFEIDTDSESDVPNLETILKNIPDKPATKKLRTKHTSTSSTPDSLCASSSSGTAGLWDSAGSVAGPSNASRRTASNPSGKSLPSSSRSKETLITSDASGTKGNSSATTGPTTAKDSSVSKQGNPIVQDVIVVDSLPTKTQNRKVAAPVPSTADTQVQRKSMTLSSKAAQIKWIIVKDPFIRFENPAIATYIPLDNATTYQTLIAKLKDALRMTTVDESQGFWWDGVREGFEIPIHDSESLTFAVDRTMAMGKDFLCLSVKQAWAETAYEFNYSDPDSTPANPPNKKANFKQCSKDQSSKTTAIPSSRARPPGNKQAASENRGTILNDSPKSSITKARNSHIFGAPSWTISGVGRQQAEGSGTTNGPALQGIKPTHIFFRESSDTTAEPSFLKEDCFRRDFSCTGPRELFPGSKPYRSPSARPGLKDTTLIDSVEDVDLHNTGYNGKPKSTFWAALAHESPAPLPRATSTVEPIASPGVNRFQPINLPYNQPFIEATPPGKSLFVSPASRVKTASRQLTPSPSPPASTKSSRRKDKKARRSMARQSRECSTRTDITNFEHYVGDEWRGPSLELGDPDHTTPWIA